MSKLLSSSIRKKSVIPVIILLSISSLLGLAPLFSSTLPSASASSPLIQQNNNGCFGCATATPTISFASQVTSGNVIIVAVALFDFNSPYGVFTVSDTLGTTFTEVTHVCNSPAYANCAGIAVGTAAATGSDTLTLNFVTTPDQDDIFIYDLSGVSTSGLTSGTGQGSSSPISTSSTAFSAGSFLVGVTDLLNSGTFSAGAGFTASTESSGDQLGYAQYSTSGVSSPTTFPASTTGSTWAEAGVALPIIQADAPSVTPPSIVGGNITIYSATDKSSYILVSANATVSDMHSSQFLESVFPQYGYLSNGAWGYLGYYQGTFGAVAAGTTNMTVWVTVTYNGVSMTNSTLSPNKGSTSYVNFVFH